MTCGRCGQEICDGEVAHLVARKAFDTRSLQKPMIMVCDGCLRLDEKDKGFRDEPEPPYGTQPLVAMPSLTNGQIELLPFVALGHVWRSIGAKGLWMDEDSGKMREVTAATRGLTREELAYWDDTVIPPSPKLAALLRLTFAGENVLNELQAKEFQVSG